MKEGRITMQEKKIKHLEMIQAVINRMAANSLVIKGWAITLVSALFALAAKDADVRYVFVSYFPAGMFWFLDGYFLSQERLFRKLYDKVRVGPEDSDFSMDTATLSGGRATWASATSSMTLILFYGVVISTIFFVMIFLRRSK